jgi:hypothetical protein
MLATICHLCLPSSSHSVKVVSVLSPVALCIMIVTHMHIKCSTDHKNYVQIRSYGIIVFCM